MGQLQFHSVKVNIEPAIDPKSKVNIGFGPEQLMQSGFNLLVTIATATSILKSNEQVQAKAFTTTAHFDTGANITSIDIGLAEYLELTPTGLVSQHTASGETRTPTFAIDLSFPNAALAPFTNLRIGSCRLPFNIEACTNNSFNPANFGLLIGRDIMSKWNIVWNGPSSCVYVSD
jgi:hypothetical protein